MGGTFTDQWAGTKDKPASDPDARPGEQGQCAHAAPTGRVAGRGRDLLSWHGRLGQGADVKPGMFRPSQVRLAGNSPCHRLMRWPAFCRTVAVTAVGGLVAFKNAAVEL